MSTTVDYGGCIVSAERVCAVLEAADLTFTTEDDLQEAIESVLIAAGLPAAREVQLFERGRIDLMCGLVGIEVKIAGQWAAVVRQLMRYANAPEVEALVLITNRAKHHALPRQMNSKPIHLVTLIEGGL